MGGVTRSLGKNISSVLIFRSAPLDNALLSVPRTHATSIFDSCCIIGRCPEYLNLSCECEVVCLPLFSQSGVSSSLSLSVGSCSLFNYNVSEFLPMGLNRAVVTFFEKGKSGTSAIELILQLLNIILVTFLNNLYVNCIMC